MRFIRKNSGAPALLFLLAFLSFQVDPGNAGEGFPREAGGFPDLASLVLLPDDEIPLGKALVAVSSRWGKELTGESVEPSAVEREIDRLAGKLGPALRDRSDPHSVISAMNRFLFVEEGFSYDCEADDPDNYLLDRVVFRKRGNCLGLTSLYLILAERLSLPLRAVYVPSHCFVRYEDAAVRRNIETGDGGAEWEDGRYLRGFRLTGKWPYLKSLGRKETIAVYLKSVGATFSRRGKEERAILLYRDAALFHPELPDLRFNFGVSFHKKGMLDQAISQYWRSLALDPDLAVARDNLAVALAKKGPLGESLLEARKGAILSPEDPVALENLAVSLFALGMYEECIREYRRLLAVDPDNPAALAGLVEARYARGESRLAIVRRDGAMDRGCEPPLVMPGTLEVHRDHPPLAVP